MYTEPIFIVDHDPSWAEAFAQIAAVIRSHLDDYALAIEHIGSTAVPGLAAKPILDLDMVIAAHRTQEAWKEIVTRLGEIGYAYVGDRGIPGREAFDRCNDRAPYDGSNRSWPAQHLYVCEEGSRELERHLEFRDALRTDESLADVYADLKRTLAARFRTDREGYCEAKSMFIERVLREAR